MSLALYSPLPVWLFLHIWHYLNHPMSTHQSLSADVYIFLWVCSHHFILMFFFHHSWFWMHVMTMFVDHSFVLSWCLILSFVVRYVLVVLSFPAVCIWYRFLGTDINLSRYCGLPHRQNRCQLSAYHWEPQSFLSSVIRALLGRGQGCCIYVFLKCHLGVESLISFRWCVTS